MASRSRVSRLTGAALVAFASFGLLVTGCGHDRATETPSVWRFAIEEPRGSVQDRYAQRFKELALARSHGRIHVKVYPYGTLGTSDQLTEQLYNGTIQFAMASPGNLGKIIPEVQVFLLHYVMSGDEGVNKAALRDNVELRHTFDRLYRTKGMTLLSFFSEGWQVWTTNKPIRTPEDFGDVKMRVMATPLLLAAYDAYGANPTPLPYAEVYSALQLHMIDAQVNPVFAIEEMGFYEVADYLIFPHHAQFFTSVVSGRAFFSKLRPADRRMVEEITHELHDYVFGVQKELNETRLAEMRDKKPSLQLVELTPAEQARFRERSLAVRQQYIEMVGPRGRRILDLLTAGVNRATREHAETTSEN